MKEKRGEVFLRADRRRKEQAAKKRFVRSDRRGKGGKRKKEASLGGPRRGKKSALQLPTVGRGVTQGEEGGGGGGGLAGGGRA